MGEQKFIYDRIDVPIPAYVNKVPVSGKVRFYRSSQSCAHFRVTQLCESKATMIYRKIWVSLMCFFLLYRKKRNTMVSWNGEIAMGANQFDQKLLQYKWSWIELAIENSFFLLLHAGWIFLTFSAVHDFSSFQFCRVIHVWVECENLQTPFRHVFCKNETKLSTERETILMATLVSDVRLCVTPLEKTKKNKARIKIWSSDRILITFWCFKKVRKSVVFFFSIYSRYLLYVVRCFKRH